MGGIAASRITAYVVELQSFRYRTVQVLPDQLVNQCLPAIETSVCITLLVFMARPDMAAGNVINTDIPGKLID